jgi:hypothetical protein
MNRFVASDQGEASAKITVKLTIDPDLNRAAQRELEEFVRPYPAARDPNFTAAVTIMDAKTGALLALASYPAPTHLEADSMSDRIDDYNFNFRRLPIGSVAKVPFSTVILDSNPSFADLKIDVPPRESEVETLLGTGLSPPLHDDGAKDRGHPLDFENFIAVSSDKYAAALLLLASVPQNAVQISSSEIYYFDKQPMYARGLSIFETIRNGQPEFRSTADDVTSVFNWDEKFRSLFSVDYDRTPEGGQFDTSIWAPVYGFAPRASSSAFDGVSPEQESFRMNSLKDFRTEALPMILGNGEARWTNIKIAQTFARIVTGTTVSAWLGSAEGMSRPSTDEIKLKPETRARITRAMAMVTADSAGTAFGAFAGCLKAAAERARAQDRTLGVFGKTGTPEFELRSFNSQSTAINSLIRLYRVRLVAGRLVLSPNGSGELPIESSTRRDLARALRGDRDALAAIEEAHVSFKGVISRLIRDTRDPLELPMRYVIRGGNLLISVANPDRIESKFGRAMVFVAALYPPGVKKGAYGLAYDGTGTPLSAVAIAVNLGDNLVPGIHPHMGAQFAARLFADIVVPRLLPSGGKWSCR